MALRYWLLPLILLLLRAADVMITYVVSPDLRWEMNPLVSVAGLGWSALLFSNIAGVALVVLLHYYSVRLSIAFFPSEPGYSVKEFVSHYLFGERDSFRKIYYVVPYHKRVILQYCGYVFVRVLTVWSFIVVLHNFLVWRSASFRFAAADLKLWLGIYGLLIVLVLVYTLRFFRLQYKLYNASRA